jgi:hypothetical protein
MCYWSVVSSLYFCWVFQYNVLFQLVHGDPITVILEEIIEVRTQRKPLATNTLYPITVILEELIEVRTQRKPLATNTLYPITVILEELIEVPRGNH